MDTVEFLQSVRKKEVTMATQEVARDLISSLSEPRVNALNERVQTGEYKALLPFPFALCLDLIDAHTGFVTKRPQVYRLNRELGLSTLEAIKHTSPSTGHAAAIIALAAEAPE